MSVLSIRRGTSVPAVILVLLAACGTPSQRNHPHASITPSEPSVQSPAVVQHAKALLFPTSDGLWFYTLGSATARRIAGNDPRSSWGWGFALRNATEATYFFDQTLRSFDAAAGTTRELLKAPGGFTMDWSPDGRTLAYMTVDFDSCSCATAYIYTPGDTPHRLWTSKGWGGRGASQQDEASISWSPDGTRVLIVLTALDTAYDKDRIVPADTIYVLRTDGSAAMPSRFGTMARWSPDGTAIYYRRLDSSREWRRLNVADGTEASIGLPPEAYRPHVSLDGSKISFDDGKDHPSVFVFDLDNERLHFIDDDHASAVWLSPTTLAAGETELCGNCEGPQWKPSDGSTRWDLTSLTAPKADPISIGSIARGSDVAYG